MAANNIEPNSVNDNCEQYFEGVEKLLEIWFTNDGENSSTKQGDLRKISRQQFESLLKIVRCEIISYISNDEIDAYVLSESSMFVSKRRLILKTCGTTTPLLCLGALLRLAEQIAGFTNVQDLFYSRKNYGRPELQHTPHHAFDQEVALLDSFFENGSAYCLGSMNRDCWYLYTLNPAMIGPLKSPPSALESSVMLPPFSKEKQNEEDRCLIEPDQTLEILMTNLDLDIMAIFTREESQTATEATKRSGIDKLIPNMVIDDFLFEPCGYSMNGISKTGHYMTIHITPEQDFSYVSFETNAPLVSYKDLMNRVLNTFKPNEAVVTIFANQTSMASEAPRELDKVSSLGDWLRRDIQHCRFKHYDLTYAFYSKFPS